MEVPLYQLFYDGDELPALPKLPKQKGEGAWGDIGKGAHDLARFRTLLGRIKEPDRKLLLNMAQKMAGAARNRV